MSRDHSSLSVYSPHAHTDGHTRTVMKKVFSFFFFPFLLFFVIGNLKASVALNFSAFVFIGGVGISKVLRYGGIEFHCLTLRTLKRCNLMVVVCVNFVRLLIHPYSCSGGFMIYLVGIL